MNNVVANDIMNRNRIVDTLYCHFSFRRPKGKDYGLFAVALYTDYDGKNLLARETRRIKLWQNHQFISAAQSYENVLNYIYRHQVQLKKKQIKNILLVTDNSILAGWIMNPKKNKEYTAWMDKAIEKYRIGAEKEIISIAVGLCKTRDYEKSYKYCKEEYVIDENKIERKDGVNVVNVSSYNNVYDTIKEDDRSIEIKGQFDEV